MDIDKRLYQQLESKEKEPFVSKRVVVKIGSSTITGGGENLDIDFMSSIAAQISTLYKKGVAVHIVTSGAVACGKQYISRYDGSIVSKQIAAAMGQPILIEEWKRQFNAHGINIYQLLLTEHNLEYARTILSQMTDGIPIINANDPVNSFEMQQFLVSADNDRLAGHVASAIEADTAFLLTDVTGVRNRHGQTIQIIDPTINYTEDITFHGKSTVGTGGMESKHLVAMALADRGIRAIIGNGRENEILLNGARGQLVGTTYLPREQIHDPSYDA
ncbi:hypothetical protein BH09PAT2_BH09PAT2_09530 [soil metagenome]